ncbi:MAG: hypothetical protein ACRC4W_07435 [Treponemataceae bacterium]
MMNIIASTDFYIVWGAADRGKTTTIRYLADYMLNNNGKVLYSQTISIPRSGDFQCIIEHTNKQGVTKVYAIMSAGDPSKNDDILNNGWSDLNNYTGNIDVVIGASRTRGATVTWWLGKSSNIKWIECNNSSNIVAGSNKALQELIISLTI